MEKILLKRIGLIFVILSIPIFMFFSATIFFTESNIAIDGLNEMIEQVEGSYNKSKVDTQVVEELFEKDYLNRAYTADFILNNNAETNYNITTLKKIKELIEVESIYLIDDTGEIVLSSDENSIGINLKEHKESEPFVELIDSSDPKATVVQLDAISITDNKSKIFIGVKSSSDKYSVVQIGLDAEVLEDILAKQSIETIVKNTSTVYGDAVFVINENNGGIDTITVNNEQKLDFDAADTKEEELSILNSSIDGKLIKINGSLMFLKTKIIDDKIIGAYVNAKSVFKAIFIEIVYLLIGILTILLCGMKIFRYCLNRFVLNDLASIALGIKQLMDGSNDVTFKTNYNTEFREITAILNDWKENYQTKSEIMTRLTTSLNDHAAIFECFYTINKSFFTENMKSILGMNDEEWKEISKSPKDFLNHLKSLMSLSDEGVIPLKNDRFISITLFIEDNVFFGMIMDKTKDVILKNRIQQELYAAQVGAEIDPLTNLSNRAGFEKYVKKSLENEPGIGIMIIFDLDNFKRVNDELGHPEGDEVLKKFAHCLRSYFRQNDVVARMGGDEFVVFLHSIIPVEVISNKLHFLLKNIRKELNDYYSRFELSTSIGVAYVDKSKNSYDDLYKCADVGLLIAKGLGKDGFYINEEHIRCTTSKCIQCNANADCKNKKFLGL